MKMIVFVFIGRFQWRKYMTEKEIEIVMNALAGYPVVTTVEFANKVEKALKEYKEADEHE